MQVKKLNPNNILVDTNCIISIIAIKHKIIKQDISNFNKAKFAELKKFIGLHKYSLLYAWVQFFENNVKVKTIRITKKIK